MSRPQIIPAILSDKMEDYKKFSNLYSDFTDKIHIDVMDGEFVLSRSPNVFDILNSIQENKTQKAIHLMIKNPINTLSILGETNANIFLVYIHVETIDEETYSRLLGLDFPFKIGFVFDPRTDFEKYADLLVKTEIVQIMTVNPGLQNTRFLPESLEKLFVLRNRFKYKGEIHVDGGINAITLPSVLECSPNILGVGSAIQKAENPKHAFEELNNLLKEF